MDLSNLSATIVAVSKRSTRRDRRYGALLLTGMVVQTLLTGCKHTPRQAMSELFNSVPSAEPKKDELSVTANVAAIPPKSDSATLAPSGAARNSRPPSTDDNQAQNALTNSSLGAAPPPFDQEPLDIDLAGYEPAPTKSKTGDSETPADPIERLRAALHEDSERAKSTSRLTTGAHEVRVRVDSMLERSRRLFDLGQLREARHTAKAAHDLGDSARLDYLPDEERPIDLVQRIDEQLREVEQGKDAASTVDGPSQRQEPVTSASGPLKGTGSNRDPRTAKSVDADADAASRPKKDWSYGLNVFRRDRKANVTEASPNPPLQVQAPQLPVQMGIETEADSDTLEKSDGAVVQANRSLTMYRAADQSAERVERQPRDMSAPIAYAPYQRAERREEPQEEFLETIPAESEVEQQSASFEANFEQRELDTTSVPPAMIEDDATPPPTDFDEVTPISPARENTEQTAPDTVAPRSSDSVRSANSNWLYGLAGFAICAGFATVWYRRGAT